MARRKSSKADSGGAAIFALPEELTIQHAAALRESLLAQLGSETLEIDASAVERVDAAGVQVLAAFCRSRGDATWTWMAPSPVLDEAARQLDLASPLKLPDPAN